MIRRRISSHRVRVQPPFGSWIDPGHPLAKAVLSFYVANKGWGDRLLDLGPIRNHATFGNSVSWGIERPQWQGLTLTHSGSPASQNSITIPDHDLQDGDRSFTWLFQLSSDSALSAGETWMQKKGGGADSYEFSWEANENLKWAIDHSTGSSNIQIGLTVGAAQYHTICMGHNAPASLAFMRVMRSDNTFQQGTGSIGDPNATGHDVLFGTELTGRVRLIALFNKPLFEDDVRSFHYDPWQLLLWPARTRRPARAAAAVSDPATEMAGVRQEDGSGLLSQVRQPTPIAYGGGLG